MCMRVKQDTCQRRGEKARHGVVVVVSMVVSTLLTMFIEDLMNDYRNLKYYVSYRDKQRVDRLSKDLGKPDAIGSYWGANFWEWRLGKDCSIMYMRVSGKHGVFSLLERGVDIIRYPSVRYLDALDHALSIKE